MRNIPSLAGTLTKRSRTVSGTVRRTAAKLRLQYWAEVLERAAGLLGASGVLRDARTGKGQLFLLVLMIVAPTGSSRS